MADLLKFKPLCHGFLYNIVQLVGTGAASVTTFIGTTFTKLPSNSVAIVAGFTVQVLK